MARIRTIKPEFFKHGDLYDAERETGLPLRLAFAGIWCLCDREGRFRWKPREMKLDILPYDQVDFSCVLDALEKYGFLVKYECGGECYGAVPSFTKHQSINMREAQSHLPAPGDSVVPAMGQRVSTNGHIVHRETVYARDGHKCVRCGSGDDLTIDHIFPVSMGGTHAVTNLRTMCRSCNSARPVAGQALIDDLRQDGISMDDMQRMCMHVHAPDPQVHACGEGKGREGKGREYISPDASTGAESAGGFDDDSTPSKETEPAWYENPEYPNKPVQRVAQRIAATKVRSQSKPYPYRDVTEAQARKALEYLADCPDAESEELFWGTWEEYHSRKTKGQYTRYDQAIGNWAAKRKGEWATARRLQGNKPRANDDVFAGIPFANTRGGAA